MPSRSPSALAWSGFEMSLAVVAGVAEPVGVLVELVGVRQARAVVAGIAGVVAVLVGLVGVRRGRAVVAREQDRQIGVRLANREVAAAEAVAIGLTFHSEYSQPYVA